MLRYFKFFHARTPPEAGDTLVQGLVAANSELGAELHRVSDKEILSKATLGGYRGIISSSHWVIRGRPISDHFRLSQVEAERVVGFAQRVRGSRTPPAKNSPISLAFF